MRALRGATSSLAILATASLRALVASAGMKAGGRFHRCSMVLTMVCQYGLFFLKSPDSLTLRMGLGRPCSTWR